MRIVLADDHEVVRAGLQLVLEREAQFTVVAVAGDVASARALVTGHRPDVLVLDLNMPGGSSLEAIPKLRAEVPDTQIVVLTMQADAATVRAARMAGALGYVLKEAAGAELVEAVHRAAAGERYINRAVASSLVIEWGSRPSWD